MPHAGGPSSDSNQSNQSGSNQSGQSQSKSGESEGIGSTISAQAGKLTDYVRENPKTAAAAGAAIVGAIAAAAIPLVRGRSDNNETANKNSGSSKKGKQGA
jgi:hypothetical protein